MNMEPQADHNDLAGEACPVYFDTEVCNGAIRDTSRGGSRSDRNGFHTKL